MATLRPNLIQAIDHIGDRYRMESERLNRELMVGTLISPQHLNTSATTMGMGPNYTAAQIGAQQDAFMLAMHQAGPRHQPYTWIPPTRNNRNDPQMMMDMLNMPRPSYTDINMTWDTPAPIRRFTPSPLPRNDLPILYKRMDSAMPSPRRQRKTRMYKDIYFNNMLRAYGDLHITFPYHNHHNHLCLSFRRESEFIQSLYIDEYMALQFISIRKQEIVGDTMEIHLCKICSVGNDRNEKLKRLFLRHMGFNCTRYDNKLRILFKDNTRIILPKDKEYKLHNQSPDGYTNNNSKIGTLLIKANPWTKL